MNEHLLTGPDLTSSLTGVLLRFRQQPVALMCDIQNMFHRFRVKEEDCDYLRYLWWEQGDVTKAIEQYRMKVHIFGAGSSPGCASYGLRYLARQHEAELPTAAKFVQRNFYVDDSVISVTDTGSAIMLAQDVRALQQRESAPSQVSLQRPCCHGEHTPGGESRRPEGPGPRLRQVAH